MTIEQKKMYTIIIIDDHLFTIRILKQILEKQHYKVKHFTEPLGALAYLMQPESDVDLIVSDMMMEKLSGLELMKRIKQNPRLSIIPFIFLTSSNELEHREEAFQFGAIDFFKKPVNSNLFVSKISSLLLNLALTRLNCGLILQGNEDTLKPDELLKYCESENVSGFLYASNGTIELDFLFIKGQIDIEKDISATYEQLLSWKHYHFLIARGKLQLEAVRQFIKQVQVDSPARVKGFDFDRLFERYKDLENIYTFKNKWMGIKPDKKSSVVVSLSCLSETNQNLSELQNQEPGYMAIDFLKNRKLLVLKYNNRPMAFLFNSNAGFDDLLHLWEETTLK